MARYLWLLLGLLAACGTSYALRHRVQEGDSVETVSRQYGVPEVELRRFNQLQPADRVQPGDILFVPGAVGAVVEPRPASPPAAPPRPTAPAPPPRHVSEAPGGSIASGSARASR